MSCYHPMVGYYLPTPYSGDEYLKYKEWRKAWYKKVNEQLKKEGLPTLKNHGDFVLIPHEAKDYFERLGLDTIDVPCGKCIGCLLDKSVDWANRCTMEAVAHEHNYFITFTYDDDHIPLGGQGFATLKKDDFEKIIKKIRNYWKKTYNHDGIKFFGCGEYGSKTSRPHYHICFFNLPIQDLTEDFIYKADDGSMQVAHQKNSVGLPMFDSPIIKELWDKGNITIDQVNWSTSAYLSRYTTKKIGRVDSSLYQNLGIEKEFIRMSNHPGLGFGFFEKYKDYLIENDNLIISTQKGAKKIPIPRYFDKLIAKDDEKLFYSIKNARKMRSVRKQQSVMSADPRSFKEIRASGESNAFAKNRLSDRDKI